MNKVTIAGIIALVLVVLGGGAVFVVKKDSDTKKANEKTLMTSKEAESIAMKQKDDAAMTNKDEDTMMKKDEPTSNETTMMHKGSGFITLADYKSDTSKYSDSKKVYFFHASWCPVCQSIQKEIEADPSKIPADTVLIKVDYDSNTDLRQQYGVTYQYTFVQFDSNGAKLAKWSASTYEKALAGVI